VQEGDTVRGIAQEWNVSVEDLLRWNNLTPEEADAIRPGQELIVSP
jgi:LysM repeat protein